MAESGLAPRGASGLKFPREIRENYLESLAPRGASGLKCNHMSHLHSADASRPARGEWIEIDAVRSNINGNYSLAPRGASGLKFRIAFDAEQQKGVSPREGRVD